MAENEAIQLAKGQTNVPVASTSPGIFQLETPDETGPFPAQIDSKT